MQVELHELVADGEVTRGTHVPAVEAGKQLLAIRTSNAGTDGSGFNQQFSIECMHRINPKAGQGKRKHKHLSIQSGE